ncbi:hypothetical protein DSO57_1030707 [Entomophthora muscae]|nr:hypothetical protein DSO57_1030707 [Entomophthora muscae]
MNNNVTLIPEYKVLYRSDIDLLKRRQVTLVSGGGAGHEPSHAGFVGPGMLSAAISGNTFASPSTQQIFRGLSLCVSADTPGCLLIVKRYTGDMLNFGFALEMARAKIPGARIALVAVDDDVGAEEAESDESVGRRGLAGTVLMHKILGGLADKGYSFEDMEKQGRLVASSLGTIGVSLNRCLVPASQYEEKEEKTENAIEFGLGIHNEPGYQKLPLLQCKELVGRVMTKMQEAKGREFSINNGSKVVLFINNLGGTSKLEEGVVVKEALEWMDSKAIQVEMVICGTMMTSLNMHGISVTCLTLPRDESASQAWLDALASPTSLPSWNGASIATAHDLKRLKDARANRKPLQEDESSRERIAKAIKDPSSSYVCYIITQGCKHLLQSIPDITRYDEIAGDGDCGHTMESAAKAIIALLHQEGPRPEFAVPDCETLSQIMFGMIDALDRSMGGTSGALFRILILGLTKGVLACKARPDSFESWKSILKSGIDTLYHHTAARVGDRTLVDSIGTFIDVCERETGAVKQVLDKALQEADTQTEKTRKLPPRFGRSSYIETQRLIEANVPDPGALAVSALLRGLCDSITAN